MSSKYDFDLVFIGSGSAAFAGAIKGSDLGKKVAIVEKGTIGGTCVNVGCVPSKTLLRAAQKKHQIENSNFSGVKPGKAEVNFSQLIKDKDSLVGDLRESKYQSILDQYESITLIEGQAKFRDPHTLDVSGKTVTADKIIVSTGSRPFIPSLPGLHESGFLTSTTAFELDELPRRLAVLGGGYIALETAQMFQRLGSEVTIIQRSDILSQEDHDVREWMGRYLQEEGIRILDQTEVKEVRTGDAGLKITLSNRSDFSELEVDQILVATGRRPNTDDLNLEAAGVELNENGTIQVNEFGQTTQDNIYAAGDVTASPALVYVAAYEGNLAAENALLGNTRKADLSTLPWVIFSDPQVVGVGLNEVQAKALGIEYDLSLLTMDNVPRFIAARDTRGFVKLLKRKGEDELLGARIVAPEGSELIMELSMILKYKIPISEVATLLHPYLTQSEAIKLAAQTFNKDIKKLSCCAT